MSVKIENLSYSWSSDFSINIDQLNIDRKERVFIHGESGSGKSTLLGLICGIHQASSGQIKVLDEDITAMSASNRDQFRANHIGYVFQQFNLISYLSVLENVSLVCEFSNIRKSRLSDVDEESRSLLRRFGLGEKLDKPVTALSIGQQQRVAVARALIGSPEIIICDEPSSALDEANRDAFMDILLTESAKHDTCLIFVSHDKRLEKHFDRHIDLREICK